MADRLRLASDASVILFIGSLVRRTLAIRYFNNENRLLRIPVIVGGDSGSNVGSDSGRSWAASAEMLAAALFTVSRAQGQALFRFAFAVCAGTRP